MELFKLDARRWLMAWMHAAAGCKPFFTPPAESTLQYTRKRAYECRYNCECNIDYINSEGVTCRCRLHFE